VNLESSNVGVGLVPILLINGPFGVGKSTVASLIVEQIQSAMLFDPEIIGAFLHRLVGPEALSGDYQDLPWIPGERKRRDLPAPDLLTREPKIANSWTVRRGRWSRVVSDPP
jgi:hypothetical protein